MADIAVGAPSVFVNSNGLTMTWDGTAVATGTNGTAFSTFPAMTVSEVAPAQAGAESDGTRWSGPVAFEGEMTGDGRLFAPGAIGWLADSLPWPFRWTPEDHGGHDGAVVIGRVDAVFRDESSPGVIFASGVVFTGESAPPEAAAYLDLLTNGAAGGVSVDGDMAEFTVVEKTDANGMITGLELHFSQMRLRTMTAVDVPAFAGARISLSDFIAASGGRDDAVGTGDAPDAVTAAAIPVKPPRSWFDEPCFPGPTPITITADGYLCGHLATKGTCHISFGEGPDGRCRRSADELMGYSNYDYFHVGELETDDGELVAVGHFTFATGHADTTGAVSARAAAAWYDDTGTIGADVRAGEDEFGIWIAGAVRPHLTDEEIREFRSAPPSGDWRRIGGRLELVAAHGVVTPGFPVPRTRARVLVASGVEQAVILTSSPSDFETITDEARAAAKQRLANTVRKSELRHRLVRK